MTDAPIIEARWEDWWNMKKRISDLEEQQATLGQQLDRTEQLLAISGREKTGLLEQLETLRDERDAFEEALLEIVTLHDNATEHYNDLGMSDVAHNALVRASSPARSPLAKAQAFVRGEVQGKCCDLWPECSHVYEAVNSEEPESA